MHNIITKTLLWAAKRPRPVISGIVGIAAVLVTATTAMAIIPDTNSVIHACYRTSGPANGPIALGTLRIIDSPSQTCDSNETAISWDASNSGNGGPVGLGQLVTNDFTNANLEEFDLRYRDFHNINFSGANLTRAKFSSSDVNGANFTAANLTATDMIQQDLATANLTNANMLDIILTNSSIGSTSLSGVSMINANITNTTGFAGRDYRTGINIKGIRFIDTDLTGANFSGYEFTAAPVPIPQTRAGRTVFRNSNLTNTNFSSITAALADVGIEFNGSNLSGADFTNAVIPSRSNQFTFQDTTGTNVNFSGADMRGAHFHRANLTDVNFTGVNLSKGPISSGVPARFFSAVLTNANFTNTNLLNAIGFTTATLINPIWSNTTCPDGTNSDANGGTCIGHFPPEPFIE